MVSYVHVPSTSPEREIVETPQWTLSKDEVEELRKEAERNA